MGGKSSPSGNTSSTVTNTPWSGVTPYITQALNSASGLFNNTGLPGAQTNTGAGGQTGGTGAPPATGASGLTQAPDATHLYHQYGPNGQSLGYATTPNGKPTPGTAQQGTGTGAGTGTVPAAGGPSLLQQYFPGSTVASQSPATQAAIQALINQSLGPQSTNLNNATNNQITDTLNGAYLNPQSNPGFQQALTDTQKAYSTGTAAQTDAAFNNAGGYGGSAYQETKQNQNKAFADSLNSLAGNLYSQGRSNQLQAAALAPQTSALGYSNIDQLGSAGQMQDSYNQSQLNDMINRFNFNQQAPINALQNYEGLVTGSGASGGTSTSSQPYFSNGAAGGIGSALSGALGGAALFNAFPATLGGLGLSAGSAGGLGGLLGLGLSLSDIRAKDNIEFVGFEKGIPVYDFTYKGETKRMRGVMAQDVMRVRPDAIGGRGDYFTVDYNKLGLEMKEAA